MPFKKFTPHAVAGIIFFLLLLFYYYPVIFQGKRIHQSDVINYKGLAHESEYYFLRNGHWPLWNSSVFSGMPNYQIAARYPANIFTRIYQGMLAPFKTSTLTFLGLIGFYILLVSMGINPWLSITGAIAYAFSTYFFIIIEVGHNSKTMTLALMPAVVAGVLLLFRGQFLKGTVLMAFFLPLAMIANHAQMIYYFLIILLIFSLFEFYTAIKEKRLTLFFKATGLIAIIGLLSLASNSTLMWMTYEYGKYSTRGKSELTFNKEVQTSGLDKDYATDWSYGISETFTILVSNFSGNSSQSDVGTDSELYKTLRDMGVSNAKRIAENAPTYWGSQPFTEGPFYFGAVVCFLFLLGIFLVEGPVKWWLLTATVLSILLSWGKNLMAFTDLFFEYFPMYDKFRAVATILVIAMFAMPLLGFIALNRFLANIEPIQPKGKKIPDNKTKPLKYSFIIIAALLLILALFPDSIFSFKSASDKNLQEMGWPVDALISDRITLAKKDAWRSLFFIVLAALSLWAFLKNKIRPEMVIASMSILILIDLGWVAKRYLPVDRFIAAKDMTIPHDPAPADMQILQNEMRLNPDIQKYADTLNNIFKERARKEIRESKPGTISEKEKTLMLFASMDKLTNFRVFNLSVSTFNDASTSYFHKSIGGYHGAKMKRYQELIEHHISRNNYNVLNMLNTKYIIVDDKEAGNIARLNPGALGHAWFVQKWQLVENSDSEIVAMRNFDPSVTAVVDKRFSSYLEGLQPDSGDSLASISLVEFELDRLSYKTKSVSERLAVFSEIWYDKGWNAFIDGKAAPHIRLNYVLRGLRIPAGEHTVEFRFKPENYYRCEKISLASSITLLLVCVGGFSVYILRALKKQ